MKIATDIPNKLWGTRSFNDEIIAQIDNQSEGTRVVVVNGTWYRYPLALRLINLARFPNRSIQDFASQQ